jgi:hypothetical protein
MDAAREVEPMTAGRRRGRETAGGPAPQRLGKVLLVEEPGVETVRGVGYRFREPES